MYHSFSCDSFSCTITSTDVNTENVILTKGKQQKENLNEQLHLQEIRLTIKQAIHPVIS